MSIIVKKITAYELSDVSRILKAVVSNMKSIGFTQWDDDYPTIDILKDDINSGWLYGAYQNDVLTGFSALNCNQDAEYGLIFWQYGTPALVVHRLQIDPAFRGQNIAYELMMFAENLAKEKGCVSIRLDTRYDNKPAINLYKKLGYQRRGHVHFPRMCEFVFPCFEKKVL